MCTLRAMKSDARPHVCPWWLGYLLASPLRKLMQNPRAVVAPWLREGMTVLEPGPGMGFFTLEMAHLVGPAGRVVAVDIQPRMLANLRKRVAKAGLAARVDVRQAQTDSLGIADLAGTVDFALAFALVHELADQAKFFAEIFAAMKPAGVLLFAEPSGHVSEEAFESSLSIARGTGFLLKDRPRVKSSRTAAVVRG